MKKKGDVETRVVISIGQREGFAEVTIENYGVAIRRDEIDSEKIFGFGFRGRESDDRGRAGTGIGLYDARQIVESHGGKLRIESVPTAGNSPTIYSNPVITKAYVIIPLIQHHDQTALG